MRKERKGNWKGDRKEMIKAKPKSWITVLDQKRIYQPPSLSLRDKNKNKNPWAMAVIMQ